MLPGYRQAVRRLALLVALSLCALSLFAAGCGGKGSSSNAPGPVKGWGKGGLVRLADFEVSKILEDSSGRALALGITNGLSGELARAEVVRLRPDGSLDPSFGKGGIVRWPYKRSLGWLMGVVLPNGKIVLAGATEFGVVDLHSSLVVSELGQNGRIVKSFGKAGSFSASKASCLRGPAGIAAQGNRVVVAVPHFCGSESPRSIVLMRLKPDGGLDNSFGRGGHLTVAVSRAASYLSTPVLVLPQGRLAVAVPAVKGGRAEIVGLLENGAPDLHFGHKSIASARVAFDASSVSRLALFQDQAGRFSLTGCNAAGPFLTRFSRTGSRINFWEGSPWQSGYDLTNVENFGGAFSSEPAAKCALLAQLTNGEYVVAGGVLAHIKSSGVFDVSYPTQPLFTFDGMHAQNAWDLLVASDGTVLATARTGKYATNTLIARYR